MKPWEKFLAGLVHILFYVLMIGMPLSGWLIVSSGGLSLPTMLYGIIPWPAIPLPDTVDRHQLHELAARSHGYAAFVLAGLIVLHIGAAWKHHLFDHDDVLLRMAPRFLHPFLRRLQPTFRKMTRYCLALLAALLFLANPVFAAGWQVDYSRSHIYFLAHQGDDAISGEFKKFTATVDFIPANPEIGHINVVIDAASIVAGDPQRNRTLLMPDWFDTRKFPKAYFQTTGIVPAAPDTAGHQCYAAQADLKIKSSSHQVMLPFCLTPDGAAMHATGKLNLIRNDYGIGIGEWATEAYVKSGVEVSIDLVATPVSP